ncbi:retrovirus-related pol polyprotein from transposon TNT 1-94 [Tanacetum coccineum]|uniref:Retrovirus-related pol polyprotein from transposon TNT 1-94 n=1 Tax=Tanacetum coccineum TaxID=301880 RepID=A0ABQ5GJH0_9ASTR
MVDRDEGGGDDVDGSVVVASDGGDGEGGVEMMPAAGRSMGRVFKTHLRRQGVKLSGEIDIEFKIVNEYSVRVNKVPNMYHPPNRCPLRKKHPGIYGKNKYPFADRDEGGGDDVDGSVVVASNGGDGEGGVEIMPAASRSWMGGGWRGGKPKGGRRWWLGLAYTFGLCSFDVTAPFVTTGHAGQLLWKIVLSWRTVECKFNGKITVVILVRDRCHRGKGPLKNLFDQRYVDMIGQGALVLNPLTCGIATWSFGRAMKLYASCDVNDLFVFDDVSIRKSQVSKMPFRKKPRDSLNVHSRSNSNKSLPRTVFRWLPKMQPLAEPVAKWIPKIVQICLWIIDSGCSKHMTGNRALLTNFVEKFLGTVRFGNNDFAVIAGYGDVVIGSMTIKKVYYVEGLGHNLFSVGQFCDKGLEVAFRKSTCFVRNEDGVDLLTGDRSSNLYTISLNEIASNSSACLLAKASFSQSWLWHQRLSHLNFTTINNLVKNNLVRGLPKMKFEKDHLCFACEQGKIHQKHHKSKTAFASNKPLYLLHMDLCGPMRVENEASKVIISFIKKTQVNLQLQVQRVRSDNGTEFKNKTLAKFFDEVGISQQFSAARTPQQNGVVERRNRTLAEVARTMLTFANLPLFLNRDLQREGPKI